MTSRRTVLRHGAFAAVAAGLGLPQRLRATPVDTAPRAGDPTLRELAARVLDAAKSAGASYADVRFTLTRKQAFYYGNAPVDSEHIAIGVRAMANGAWGFVAGPRWTTEAAAQLGRAAVEQARANAWTEVPPVELDTVPPPVTGSWTHAITTDPFAVPVDEKLDYIRAAEAYARTFRNGGASSILIFERQERTFASTTGSFCTQTLYNSLGNGSSFLVGVSDPVTHRMASRNAWTVTPTAAGYELFDDMRLLDQIPQLYEEAKQLLTVRPLETPSRYDVVFDARAMASIVDETVGAALELDRALGLEANASGTSYLAPPASALGAAFAPAFVNVTADRSQKTGAATVKWDDDGVTPDDYTLVRSGAIADYTTNREHAPALAAWYAAQGRSVRSHGCSASGNAMDVPLIHTPNLTLQPGPTNASLDDLIADVDDGFAFIGGGCDMDQQKMTGQGGGEMVYRVRRGKVTGLVGGAAFRFRSSEFWKNVVALGGASSVGERGMTVSKGQPQQTTVHTVRAVAARVRNVVVFDPRGEGR